ncbi:MAG: putative porin [Syntrophobacteraceae bacterium]
MKNARSIIVSICLLLAMILPASLALAKGASPAPGSQDGMGAMIELLRQKGLISPDEASALLESTKGGASGHEMSAVLQLLQHKGIISAEEAASLAAQSGASAGQQRVVSLGPGSRDEEYVRQLSKRVARELQQDIQKQVKTEVQEETGRTAASFMASAPDWAQRIRFGGDIRLRYENDIFDKNNAALLKVGSNGTVSGDLLNTTEDRERFRIRARLGLTAKIHDTLEAGMRVTTGNENDPISTNETLGDYFNKDGVVMDLAYLKWSPIKELTFWGGRHPNPFFYTDLVWDNDLNLEGVAGSFNYPLSDQWTVFLAGGVFPLQEVEFTQRDKWLFGGQVGAEFKPIPDISTKLAVAYYDYENTVGRPNTVQRPDVNDYTAPLFVQKGNTLFNIEPSTQATRVALASEYKELNVTGQVDVGVWKPIHVIFVGDYVRNLGFHKDDVARRTGFSNVSKEVDGYQVGVQVGYPKARRFGEWNAFLNYKHLEADAVVDAFTDSDFHLGGTNAEGWILGVELGLYKNVWLVARWLTSDEISGPPLAIDVFQADINAAF